MNWSNTKAYGEVQALRGVDLEVCRGEIFGFLGPNGAGKTTTIRCLLDLIRPDGGSIRVLGPDPQADAVTVRAQAGYLPGELNLESNLRVEQALRYFNALRGRRAGWDYVQALAERLGLELSTPIKNLFREQVDPAPLALVRGVTMLTRDDGAGVTLRVEGEMDGLAKAMAAFPISEFETDPAGFMDTYYFSMMHVIAGIFAIIAGSALLAADEEKGILDLVLSHPVSRSQLFWARLLALSAALGMVMLAGWLGWYLPSLRSSMDLNAVEFLRPFLPLFAILLLFGTLSLLFSMLLPAARLAGALTGAQLVTNFLLMGMANLNDNLQDLVRVMPLNYYQGGRAALGLEWSWFLGLLVAALLPALLAWMFFLRRDIRVGGERSWRLFRVRRVRPVAQ